MPKTTQEQVNQSKAIISSILKRLQELEAEITALKEEKGILFTAFSAEADGLVGVGVNYKYTEPETQNFLLRFWNKDHYEYAYGNNNEGFMGT